MAKGNMTIRMEPELKAQAAALFKSLGMDLSTATGIFYRQALRCHGLPFEVKVDEPNAVTYAAMEAAEKGEDMYGPFDTIGTLIGVSDKAGMLDEDGKLPNVKQALMADAIATSAGAVLGTSTTTTFVESSAGVGAGARTGLASIVTGLLFLLAIFFAPIFTAIPGFATAPALIFVGFLMVSAIVKVDFEDLTDAVPAYLCLIAMPLMYSIAEGIAIGVISFVLINLICGKRKKITPLMYILAVLFICKYIFL